MHQTMNGGSIGYCIRGKFYSLTFLRKYLEKIPICYHTSLLNIIKKQKKKLKN